MDVDAYSPFTSRCFAWQGPGGQWTLTVVCKATFSLEPRMSPVLRESEPICEVDVYATDGVATDGVAVDGVAVDGVKALESLHAPSDLAPLKKKVDVLLVGSVFAPPNAPVSSLVARVRIGTIDKALRVVAPRTVMSDGSVREGAPWSEMVFSYERAGGGGGTWNPVGVASDRLDRHGRRSLPTVEPHGYTLDLKQAIPPAGFGPIAPSWPTRRAHLPEAHAKVLDPGWEERPMPVGFDAAFFQAAPEDQQLDALTRGLPLTLEHLHREHARLETRLEEVRPSATVEARGRPTRAISLVADTLWIDTERAIACVVWRGHLPIESRDEYGLVTVCDERELQSTGEVHITSPAVPPSEEKRVATDDEDAEPGEVEYQHTATDGETLTHSLAVPPVDPLPFRRPMLTARMPLSPPRSATSPTWPEPAEAPPSWGVVPGAIPPSAPSPAGTRETVGQRSATQPVVAATLGQRVAASTLPSARAASEVAGPAPRSVGLIAEPEPRAALEAATFAGAVHASHAAADASARESDGGVATRAHDAPIDLVWMDASVAPRVRADPAWTTFQREPEMDPLGDEARVKDARLRADRATITAVLARAEVVGDIEAHVLASVSEDGALEPRLAVVAGVIEWGFDEVETLKIWSATAAALAPGDKRVKEVADLATETLSTPLGGEAEVAASFVARLREAWVKAQKSLPNDYIDLHARRLLLQQRQYQKRTFGDAEWVRGTLVRSGSEAPIPVYLPVSAARALPLFTRFDGRILGEIVPQQDEAEKSHVAVRVSALGRVIGRGG